MKIKFLIVFFIVGRIFAAEEFKDIDQEAKVLVNKEWLKRKNLVLKLLKKTEDNKYVTKDNKRQIELEKEEETTKIKNSEELKDVLQLNTNKWALFEIMTGDKAIIYLYCSDIGSINKDSESLNKDEDNGIFFLEQVEDMVNLNDEEVKKNYFARKKAEAIVSIKVLVCDTSEVSTMKGMFAMNSSLKTISGLNNFDTSNCTDFSYMFSECSSLESVDVQNFNVQNAVDFKYMFYNCKLDELDLRKWTFASYEVFCTFFMPTGKFCNSIILKKEIEGINRETFMSCVCSFKKDVTFKTDGLSRFYHIGCTEDINNFPLNQKKNLSSCEICCKDCCENVC